MFIDRLSKNQLNVITIVSFSLATLMLILVIVLPIMLKTKKINDFTQKTSPTLDNINLWATFPGDLHSTLIHKYEIYNYTVVESNGPIKSYDYNVNSTFSIQEEVKYQNFSQTENTIYFNANKIYTYVGSNKNEEEEKNSINSINMGLFETLETLTNPPLYKICINSINYLLTTTLIEPDLFIRELFTYKIFNEIDENIIKEKILNNLSEEKIQKILSQEDKYKNYSFKNYAGLFKWIKILGNKDKISKANWLSELFELTSDEIYYILENENNYLISEYKNYNKDLSKNYKCENEDKCGIELLYTQLLDGSVISSLNSEVKDYRTLNEILQTNYYPFDKTPELYFYFNNEYKTKNGLNNDEPYTDYVPSDKQLDGLLNINSEYCLLSPNNSIHLLYLNRTEDLLKKELYYLNFTAKNIQFLSDYFYDYLPGVFLYPSFGDNSLKVQPLAKTVSTMVQKIADKTYKYMPKVNLYDYILSISIAENLKEKTHYSDLDELCPILMQKILDDGKKVNKICTDKNIGFNTIESLYKWVEPYYCLSENKNETKCNMYIINYLKDLVYISETEINKIFGEDYIGGAINKGLDAIKNSYNCGDRCDEKDYLKKLQFWTGVVTSNAPEPLSKAETIKEWFKDDVPYPIEISYYQNKYDNFDNFTEDDIDYIIKLVSENDNIYDLDNSNLINTKLKLEKEYSLYMNNKAKSSLIKLIDFLIDVFVFNDELNDNDNNTNNKQSLFVEYSTLKNLLQGNDIEDKYWIKYLSSGNYFDNFKPNYKVTTGLDIGLNLDTKTQENFDFDYLGITKNTANYNKRSFNIMNNLLTLNIKKSEYDYVKNTYIDIFSPTFNFEKLIGKRKFSDGFQYDSGLNVIYYYDSISSRPLRFIYNEDMKYKEKIECKRYNLDTQDFYADINELFDNELKYAMITQKVNKPFMLSTNFEKLKKNGNKNELKDDKKDNYICVDKISDMVIDSKINLIYGIYSRNYGFVNSIIENDKFYPIFTYQRAYEVEVNSYEQQFPGVTEYYENMTIFIIIGIIVIVICIAIGILSCIFLNKKLKNAKKEPLRQSLVPITESEYLSNRDTGKKEEKVEKEEKETEEVKEEKEENNDE